MCLRLTAWGLEDNLSGDSSLHKTDSPSLRNHYLPGALHLGVGLCDVFPIHVNM